MKTLFFETIYRPLYNLLVGLIDILPHADIGFAVIILTLIVKIILFPLSKKSIQTQLRMKEIEQPLKEIREKYKDNPQEQAQKTMAMYRESGINPFAGIFLILIQLPIVITLYFVFARSGLPTINPALLYSFVPSPEAIQTTFLGFIDLVSSKSLLVAALVLITQSIQIRFSLPKKDEMPTSDSQMAQDFMKGLHFQMKYVLPVITAVVSYSLISVVGLYWIVGNIFATLQEIYFRNTIKKKAN
jgi:YidC/Oxa1 family membrane protein insertase